jgi:hypothetical protein
MGGWEGGREGQQNGARAGRGGGERKNELGFRDAKGRLVFRVFSSGIVVTTTTSSSFIPPCLIVN